MDINKVCELLKGWHKTVEERQCPDIIFNLSTEPELQSLLVVFLNMFYEYIFMSLETIGIPDEDLPNVPVTQVKIRIYGHK